IINSPEQILLPYLSTVAGDLKRDGSIGDPNLLMAHHQGLNLLNVKYLLLADKKPGIDDRWRKVGQFGQVGVYENRAMTSRAWFAGRAVAVSESEAPEIIRSGVLPDGTSFDPRETALINRLE